MSFTTPFRPIITVVRRAPDNSELEVTLDLGGWIADGVAIVEGEDAVEAACRATCTAVNGFLPPGVEVVFGSAQHLRGEEWAREMVFVTVLLRDGDDGRDDELLGAAFVRSDPQVAAVRATLDGLTRRLAPYLDD